MRALVVVVRTVFAQDCLQVTLGNDQHPVQAFAPSTPHPALGVGVRPRCHQRSQDHSGTFALEDGIKASGELSISVVNHDPNVDTFVAQLPAQVASLLSHPGRIRFGSTGRSHHATGRQVHEEEHI